jgi:hypothetical protein
VVEVETVQPLPEEEVQPLQTYPEPPEAVKVSVSPWQTDELFGVTLGTAGTGFTVIVPTADTGPVSLLAFVTFTV